MTNANALPIQERLRANIAPSLQDCREAAERIDALEAAIKRQAGAAKTLRESTLAEVRHLQDKDRSEYTAAQTLDSEREANAMLTDEVERQASRIDALEKALRFYADNTAKCRLLHREGDVGRQALNDDGGFIARAALGEGE